MSTTDADTPLPLTNGGARVPCAESNEAEHEAVVCTLDDVSSDEAAAFKAEAFRLEADSSEACRRLGAAMTDHLSDVRMYDHAIVRYVGPYKLYGVGHSYQIDGEWMIRIARRLDALNDRPMQARLRTLRHEMSHTLGARERSAGGEWSAAEYADRCG